METKTGRSGRMLLRRVADRIRDENWLALGLDLAVVVLGILLAFEADRLHERQQDRRLEQRYLERLRADLAADTAEFAVELSRLENRLAQTQLLEDAVRDPEGVAGNPSDFVRAVEQVTWRSFPSVTRYTYDELLTSGRMTLLTSEHLRRAMAEYYTLLEDERRLGFGENDQERFRDETLGLLSAAHLSAIEDPSRYELYVSEREAVLIARQFASMSAAQTWLARLTKYQVLMRVLTEQFMTRALALISEIDAELLRD